MSLLLIKCKYIPRNCFLVVLFLLQLILCGQEAPIPVLSVNIEGNIKTRTDYLTRFIKMQAGASFDSNLVDEDMRRLRSLPSILNTALEYQLMDSGIHVSYQLKERYTLFPVGDFGVTEDNFWVGGGLMQSNLLGRGLYMYGYYQYNERNSYHFIFRNPYLFQSKWGIEVQLKNSPSTENFTKNIQTLNDNFVSSIAAKYEFRYEYEIDFGAAYRIQSARAHDMNPDTNSFKQERSGLEFFAKHEIGKLDYHSFYMDGWKIRSQVSLLFFKQTTHVPIYLFFNEFKYFHRLGRNGNYAMRTFAGISNDPDRSFYPFMADSYSNFRGIGYHAFRGNTTALINLEYRHTLYENRIGGIQGIVFTDAGFLGSIQNATSLSSDFNSNIVFSGFGLRFIYKKAYNAILAIDYGLNLQNNLSGGWLIGWGQYF